MILPALCSSEKCNVCKILNKRPFEASLIHSAHTDCISSSKYIYFQFIWELIGCKCTIQHIFNILLYPLCCCGDTNETFCVSLVWMQQHTKPLCTRATSVLLHCADSGEVPHINTLSDTPDLSHAPHPLQTPYHRTAVVYFHSPTLSLYHNSLYRLSSSKFSLKIYSEQTLFY